MEQKNKKAPSIYFCGDDKLKSHITEWLEWISKEKRLSYHTRDGYGRDMASFLAFLCEYKGELPSMQMLKALKTVDFRSYLSSRLASGMARTSISRAMSTLRNFFKWLEKNKIMVNQAVKSVKSPKVPKSLPVPIDANDVFELIKCAKDFQEDEWQAQRDVALFMLLYGCGLRIGEALSLNISDVTENGILRIKGKGGKERIVPVLSEVNDAIKEYLAIFPFAKEANKALFVGARGERINAGVVQRQLRKIRAYMGLPETATPHALRHSFATHLLQSSGNLRAVQELLGHSSLSATQRYTEIDSKKMLDVYDKTHPRAKKKKA